MSEKTGSGTAATASAAVVTATAFDALLTDLGTLAKAFPPKKEEEGASKCKHGVAGCDKDGDHEHEMKKSFTIKLEDGTSMEVTDGGELVKALSDRFDTSEGKTVETLTSIIAVIGSQGELVKSLGAQLVVFGETFAAQEKTIGEQASLIKSLQDNLGKVAATGAGRKAVLTVAERHTGTATAQAAKNGMPDGVSTDQFFAKAFDKQGQGKITGVDIALAETCLNAGMPVPEGLVSRVLS